ncbi:MAG: Rieske 2Fe-2S domain-containing protein [Streptosporangiaceae bacterium]
MTSEQLPAPAAAPPLGRVLLPLRAFLGFTFCFAGLQKLANPRFFDAADPASIQAQLAGAGRLSPIHALISPLSHVAVPLGVVIALGELAVGVGTLLGFRARAAAAGGVALALMLWLTVSFHSSPYYTGADIVFVFAWTPLLLAGSGSVLSLDAILADRAARRAAPEGAPADTARHPWRTGSPGRSAPGPGRRVVVGRGLVTAAVAVASLALGGLAAGLGRLAGGTSGRSTETSLAQAATPTQSGTTPAQTSTASPREAATAAPGQTPPGHAIGPASEVPVGQAAAFTDPSSGDPSLVIHPSAGTFVAFDAVCPHAGCTVGYNAAQKVIACPCHGSQFNPSTGAVEVGPATRGLKKLSVAEGSNGQLYVT